MAWNESGNDKNPWNQGGDKGPPDLDQVVRDLQRRLSGVFGKRGGSGGDGGGGRPTSGGGAGAGAIVGLLAVIWLLTGFYKVDDAEQGVVLRFGDFQKISTPGLHWHIPWPIETVEKVNAQRIDTFPLQTRMLTEDENIVVVDLAVQYRRADPAAYLFNVRDPDETLAEVTESAIRETVGKSSLDFVITEGRQEIARRTRELIQSTLDSYDTGIQVTSVNLQDANFPAQVQAAVEDVVKAREDRERLQLEAEAYANDIVPRARGAAARRIEDAEAYKARVVADADGESDRFLELLEEYEAAPAVTRERLYIESMEDLLGRSAKVILDAQGSGNLLYLPIDRLLREGAGATAAQGGADAPTGGDMRNDARGGSERTLSLREERRMRNTR